MAADVSTLVSLLARYGGEDGGGDGVGGDGDGDAERNHRSDLVTRDLLGGCCVVGSAAVGGVAPATVPKKELYSDLNEIMFRDVGLQQRRGGISTPSRQVQDLDVPPLRSSIVPSPVRRSAVDVPGLITQQRPGTALDPKLLRPRAAPPPVEYQSVCTLEKVKSALERAERESRRKQQRDQPTQHHGRALAASGSPASSSTTTSSAKRWLERVDPEEEGEGESMSPSEPGAAFAEAQDATASGAEMVAAGCPSCLMYVLISRTNPRCPRCSSAVPLPPPREATKKARFDLNAATASAVTATTSPVRTVKFF